MQYYYHAAGRVSTGGPLFFAFFSPVSAVSGPAARFVQVSRVSYTIYSEAMAYEQNDGAGQKKGGLGCAIFGWAVFFIFFGAVILLGYRVWFYSDKIRHGEILDLPQFTAKLTESKDAPSSASAYVDPASVESGDEPMLGNAGDPKLTIVEFGDFECPYSKDAATIVRTLMASRGDRVRFIYRDFPVESLHANALQAAIAAECAREQGKFWQYHDKLYANQNSLGLASLYRYGEETGLDGAKFQECLAAERHKDAVEADLTAAAAAGVRGTPTFFFNGLRVEGLIPDDVFGKIVDRLLQ